VSSTEPRLHDPKTGPRFAGDRDTNRRPLVKAALDVLLGYQLERVGYDGDVACIDLRLGLDRPVRVRLVGLTEITLEEVK